MTLTCETFTESPGARMLMSERMWLITKICHCCIWVCAPGVFDVLCDSRVGDVFM